MNMLRIYLCTVLGNLIISLYLRPYQEKRRLWPTDLQLPLSFFGHCSVSYACNFFSSYRFVAPGARTFQEIRARYLRTPLGTLAPTISRSHCPAFPAYILSILRARKFPNLNVVTYTRGIAIPNTKRVSGGRRSRSRGEVGPVTGNRVNS